MKYVRTMAFAVLAAAALVPIQNETVQAQRGGKNRGNAIRNENKQPGKPAPLPPSRQNARGSGNNQRGNSENVSAELQTLLTDMRQEEKLARDVYRTLSEKWNEPVFTRIAASEQQHMNTLQRLLDRYGIADPIVNDGVGAFPSVRFTQLYQQLVNEGSVSHLTALQVGLKIEEMDIADLRKTASAVSERDILKVLQRLERASHNHLRAFANRLQALGGNYQPQYLTTADFQNILRGSGTGNSRSQGGNRAQDGNLPNPGQPNGTSDQARGGRNQSGRGRGQSRGQDRGRRNGGQ